MKTFKSILSAGLVSVGLALGTAHVQAQTALAYPIFSGTITNYTTNAITGTNSVILPISEYDFVGISMDNWASTNGGTFTLNIAKSMNGGLSFETAGTNNLPVTLSNVAGTTCTYVDCRGASHLKFGYTCNVAGILTNTVYANLKSPKYGAKAATK